MEKKQGWFIAGICSEGKSYIPTCPCCVHFLCQQIHVFVNFKRALWKTPCWPQQTQSAKSSFCIRKALWHVQWVGALNTFLFPEWSSPASNSRRGTSVFSTSVYHSASLCTASVTSSPHQSQHSPFSLTVSITTYSLIPFSLLSSSVLEAYWPQCGAESSHLVQSTHQTLLSEMKYTVFMDHVASLYGW